MIVNINKEGKSGGNTIFILFLLFIFLVLTGFRKFISINNYGGILQNFSTIFVSIVLEAMPFVLLGVFIAAMIQVYITEDFIRRVIPKNRIGSTVIAAMMGFLFPVCECGIIPIAKNLMRKGVPKGAAVTFMLSVPLVNPIVLLSTYYAFYNKPEMVIIRGVFGLVTAIAIGLMVTFGENSYEILKGSPLDSAYNNYCQCCSDVKTDNKLVLVINHASEEFYNTGKYLIMGAMISAAFQTFVSKKSISFLGGHLFYSIIVMMALAFLLSICSTADAFIAKTFLNQFTIGAVTVFMIIGPMLDIKNLFMLTGAFKSKFVINLVLYIIFICFTVGVLINICAMLGGI